MIGSLHCGFEKIDLRLLAMTRASPGCKASGMITTVPEAASFSKTHIGGVPSCSLFITSQALIFVMAASILMWTLGTGLPLAWGKTMAA
jgi:hypothetical protein